MYLYRISYQWYIVLGLLLAIVVGLVVSVIATKCGYSVEEPHPDLFTPAVAKRLRKKRQTYSDVGKSGSADPKSAQSLNAPNQKNFPQLSCR